MPDPQPPSEQHPSQQPPEQEKPTSPADRAPTTPVETPVAGPAEPAAAQQAAGPPGEPSTAGHPAPGVPHPAHSQTAPGKDAVVGRVVKHRATQLVAVGLLGLVLGGGIVAAADRDHHHYGVGFDGPPGHFQFDERIPEHRFEHGPERRSER
ncbi:hypothetical protein ACRAKI_25095 [Saccharothrix isguenensis]